MVYRWWRRWWLYWNGGITDRQGDPGGSGGGNAGGWNIYSASTGNANPDPNHPKVTRICWWAAWTQLFGTCWWRRIPPEQELAAISDGHGGPGGPGVDLCNSITGQH